MSLSEIKQQAAQLSFEERQELSLFLGSIESDADLADLLSRRMHNMDAVRSVSLEAFKQRSALLDSQDG